MLEYNFFLIKFSIRQYGFLFLLNLLQYFLRTLAKGKCLIITKKQLFDAFITAFCILTIEFNFCLFFFLSLNL